MNSNTVRLSLLIVLFFGSVSAFLGFFLLLTPTAAGLPIELLKGSPFQSFVMPGIILGVVVGGTQLVAALALIKKWAFESELIAIAGFGMIIWVYAEIYFLKEVSWLQTLYFALGIVELVLLLVRLKGASDTHKL